MLRFMLFVMLVVLVYSLAFHVIMIYAEGERHPWIAGPYFVLVTMSTLGFGDLVFDSTAGRVYSVVVLLSGILLLLSILPFLFVRLIYTPWMEAQSRSRVNRKVPDGVRDHILVCSVDALAAGLMGRLRAQRIPHYVLESDQDRAALLHEEGWPVIKADLESKRTYEHLGADRARMVVANVDDPQNTNITLTVREVAPEVDIIAIADREDSIDILQLAGASQVAPLKRLLGEQLAIRVNAGNAKTHVIGRYHDLFLAELPAHRTPLAGKTVQETKLREVIGINVLAIWERGRLSAAKPESAITNHSVLVVLGTDSQISALDELLIIYDPNPHPILVIGGGVVGQSSAKALTSRDIPVHLVEKDPKLADESRRTANRVFLGDAADLSVLEKAGITKTPSVVLTTRDDAMNIYLSIYCRRLNPELRIISRITHERNIEAIHRAGADLVLSDASLGIGIILAALQGHEAVLIGEGIDLFTMSLPRHLAGQTLAESRIGSRTGLNVIAVRHKERVTDNPPADMVLEEGCEILALGTPEQLEAFHSLPGRNGMGPRARRKHHAA